MTCVKTISRSKLNKLLGEMGLNTLGTYHVSIDLDKITARCYECNDAGRPFVVPGTQRVATTTEYIYVEAGDKT